MLSGCENSGGRGPSLRDIPLYPNAVSGESLSQASLGGLVRGELEQFSTNDPYDTVVRFYRDALTRFEPRVVSHTSELGPQTAISIQQDTGVVTVAIQALTDEGIVSITHMSMGQ